MYIYIYIYTTNNNDDNNDNSNHNDMSSIIKKSANKHSSLNKKHAFKNAAR